jgi:hypothetical protein
MNQRGIFIRAALTLCALTAVGSPPSRADEPRYSIEEITPIAGVSATVSRLNGLGQVAGEVGVPVDPVAGTVVAKAFVYHRGEYQLLGRHPDSMNVASHIGDLNDAGQVLVVEETYDPVTGAYVGTEYLLYDGGVHTTITGMDVLNDLGDGGHVVGSAVDPARPADAPIAAVWLRGTLDLGVGIQLRALGAVRSVAAYVNGKGEVIGSWEDQSQKGHLFSFVGGVIREPKFSDFMGAEDLHSIPINDQGMVAGTWRDSANRLHIGFDWLGMNIDAASELRPGIPVSLNRGLNEQNDLFGTAAVTALGYDIGYVYRYADQQIHDVGSLGGSTCLHGINDHGDVVGHSTWAGNVGYNSEWGPGPNIVSSADGHLLDLNTAIPADSAFLLSEWGGHINNLDQVMLEQAINKVDGRLAAVILTPLPRAAIALAGTEAGGWYSSNVAVTFTANDPVNGIREIRYSIDGAAEAVVAGATATVQIKTTGTHRIRARGVDLQGRVGPAETRTVSIRKSGVVITDLTLPIGTTGVAYSSALSAVGGTAPYRFTLVAGVLPAGLALATDGTLSGTPSAPEQAQLRIQVTDARGVASSAWLDLETVEPLVAGVPTPVPNGSGYGLYASGGKAPYTWTVDPATPLPEGTVLAYATFGGTGIGSAPVADITFVVTDALGASTTTSLTIPLQTRPMLLGPALQTFPVGVPIYVPLQATGGVGGYTWIFEVGEVLPGVYGTWSGELWGTPTTPGTYTFSPYVVDAANVASDPYTFTVVIE